MAEKPLFEIRGTRLYRKWRDGLKDAMALAYLGKRLERLAEGNPGLHRDFGTFSELKITQGPGYRVYYAQ